MSLFARQLNPHACKTYLLGVEGTQEVALVDPVLEHVPDYLRLLRESGLVLSHVIDTHTHADHISGSASLKDLTGCEYVMHSHSPVNCAHFRVDEGFEWLLFDRVPVRVMHTPGHTLDSICLVFPDRVFTGDTLFLDAGGGGRDDLPGGDPGAHWESLLRLAGLPERLVVYPAHDYGGRNPSSMGRQKRTNPFLQKRSREEYVRYLDDLRLGPADWMMDVLRANYACARDLNAAWIPVDMPACEVKGSLGASVNEIMVTAIPPAVLKQKLGSRTPLLLLDVREKEELNGELGHIEGIRHIPVGDLVHRLSELGAHRGGEIVTVCRSGARAGTAAQILVKAGFQKVYVLAGGMLAWNTMG